MSKILRPRLMRSIPYSVQLYAESCSPRSGSVCAKIAEMIIWPDLREAGDNASLRQDTTAPDDDSIPGVDLLLVGSCSPSPRSGSMCVKIAEMCILA